MRQIEGVLVNWKFSKNCPECTPDKEKDKKNRKYEFEEWMIE